MMGPDLSGVLEQKRREFFGKIEHNVVPAIDCAGFPPVGTGPFMTGLKGRTLLVTRSKDVGDILDAA